VIQSSDVRSIYMAMEQHAGLETTSSIEMIVLSFVTGQIVPDWDDAVVVSVSYVGPASWILVKCTSVSRGSRG